MKLYQALCVSFMLVSLAAGAGCDSTSDAVDDGKAISGVSITPDAASMVVGGALQLIATVEYADGTTKDVSDDSATLWNSSDAAVATVSNSGMVAALKVGVVDISATFNTEKGNEHFVITP